jgi:hypothetical protein
MLRDEPTNGAAKGTLFLVACVAFGVQFLIILKLHSGSDNPYFKSFICLIKPLFQLKKIMNN